MLSIALRCVGILVIPSAFVFVASVLVLFVLTSRFPHDVFFRLPFHRDSLVGEWVGLDWRFPLTDWLKEKDEGKRTLIMGLIY